MLHNCFYTQGPPHFSRGFIRFFIWCHLVVDFKNEAPTIALVEFRTKSPLFQGCHGRQGSQGWILRNRKQRLQRRSTGEVAATVAAMYWYNLVQFGTIFAMIVQPVGGFLLKFKTC